MSSRWRRLILNLAFSKPVSIHNVMENGKEGWTVNVRSDRHASPGQGLNYHMTLQISHASVINSLSTQFDIVNSIEKA